MRSSRENGLLDRILSLCASHASPCARVIRRRLHSSEGAAQVRVLADTVGSLYLAELLDEIENSEWQKMGESSPPAAPMEKVWEELEIALSRECEAAVASGVLEDPFGFLKRLDDAELAELLARFEPLQLALVATVWSPAEMQRVLKALAPPAKREAIVGISRLKRLPRQVELRTAKDLAEKMRRLSEPRRVRPPVFRVEVAPEPPSSLMRPETAAILKFLRQENAALADQVQEILQPAEPSEPEAVTENTRLIGHA